MSVSKGIRLYLTIMSATLLVLALGGCAAKQEPAPEAAAVAAGDDEARLREARLREEQARREAELRKKFENADIHYDYDRYDLRQEARGILNEKAAFLAERSQTTVIIEGHCDERGSSAYNLALGEKRAKAASAYLEAMGVTGQRLETVSYGKERPLVMGNTEEAYAANRRAHFVIK
jgi:peptidoglycan-associated lipoprotein